jgi:hypothetical protein
MTVATRYFYWCCYWWRDQVTESLLSTTCVTCLTDRLFYWSLVDRLLICLQDECEQFIEFKQWMNVNDVYNNTNQEVSDCLWLPRLPWLPWLTPDQRILAFLILISQLYEIVVEANAMGFLVSRSPFVPLFSDLPHLSPICFPFVSPSVSPCFVFVPCSRIRSTFIVRSTYTCQSV